MKNIRRDGWWYKKRKKKGENERIEWEVKDKTDGNINTGNGTELNDRKAEENTVHDRRNVELNKTKKIKK